MKRIIREHISRCGKCLAHKPVLLKPAGFMGAQRECSKPWEVVSADLMGYYPTTPSGNRFLLVVTDLFTKYVEIFPIKKAEAKLVVDLLEHRIFLKHGVPRLLLFDNGGQFKCHAMNALVDKYHTTILFNYYYHPQANPTERYNQVIKRLLATYVSEYVKVKHPHRHWDKNLSELQAALNSAVHDATGFSPHRLVYGTELCLDGRLRELRCPSDPSVPECASPEDRLANLSVLKDLYITVLERLRKAYEKNSKFYNLRRRDVEYAEGQIVYRRNFEKSDAAQYFSKKLAPKYLGPFVVKRRCGTRGYLLTDKDGKEDGPWHVHDLKLTPDVVELDDK
ncbi:Transposon Tf2-11 polyprotein [Frankliniella fusca]|uniref:Transposon Tf2-11 polyprotein n=1 Tax=Frankliniella fusca TaxID=407009 RepID=A0AAE1H1V1_9NEOP|nr:Transposon Tf2-11 polyprotein [Frankliniella fusca]